MSPGGGDDNKVVTQKGRHETKEQFVTGGMPAKGRVAGPRLWLFRIIAVIIIPVFLLASVELCLRITGFGYPTSAIIKHEINGRQVCINNLKFGWRFFPKKIAREMRTFVFPADKSPQTYRIFVLGGSAAMGVPEPSYGFSRVLRVLLENEYKGVNFEVINVGMPAMNSHGVLEIAKDCARYEPDLFIVYLGNNEVTGPYGVGTVFAPLSPNLSFIRASIAAKSTRLGQLLETLISSLAAEDKRTAKWEGLQMFLEKQVRFDSPGLQNVYKHFERNLEDICELGRDAGAKVIVCNVAANLKDCPPFASLHKPELTQADETAWNKIYNQAVRLESNGRYDEALRYYLPAVQIDEQFAETHFRMGRCYWAIGKYKQAKDSYNRACYLDTLRFRAEERINEIIRSVAQKAGKEVYFVDAVKACQEAGPHGITSEELFYEHVHFKFKGNYILARTLFDQAEKAILEQRGVKRTSVSQMLSQEDCSAHLAFTGWDHLSALRSVFDGFVSHPPFTNQAYHDEYIREMKEQIESLMYYTQPSGLQEADYQYRQALEWHPSDWHLRLKYGQFLREALNQDAAAVSQLEMVLRELPHSFAYNELTVLLYKQGRIDEGLEMAQKAQEMKPLAAWTYYNLALGYDKKGQPKRAVKFYSKALEIDPEISVSAYRLMAQALNTSGQSNKAIDALRDGVKIFPQSAVLHYVLGVSLREQGKISEAIKKFRAALKAQPDYTLARNELMALQAKIENE